MFGFGRAKRLMPLPDADEADGATSFVHAVTAGALIRSELIGQNYYLGKAFSAILRRLSTDHAQIGLDELGALRQSYVEFMLASDAGTQTFDMQRYVNASTELVTRLGALREAFTKNGIDITELWKPFAQGVLDHAVLVDKLEG